jgi:hypothetical protein
MNQTIELTNQMRRVLWFLALLGFGTITSVSADTVTKPFEIGAGSAQPHSHFRTFTVPCGTRMTASVTLSRAGAAGADNDVPVFIEVRKPGATVDEDGAVGAVLENVKATRVPKTVSLPGATSALGGCSIPWRVRIKHDATGPAPNVVSGDITVSCVTPTSIINVAGGSIALKRSESTTRNIGDSQGMSQGTIVISGMWNHSILGVVGPNPVKLGIQVIDPSGQIVASATGYSNNEFRAEPRLKLVHQVKECAPGQWKLKITNVDNADDAMNIDLAVKLTRECL